MKNLFKFLLLGALTFSLAGFVGCKDYEGDIAKICDRLDIVEDDIESINDRLNTVEGGDYVVSVEPNSEQTEITVTYKKGRSVVIANPKPSEDGVDPIVVWSIGDDGYWYKDKTKTPYKVYGGAPQIKETEDGKFWAFPTIVDGEVVYEVSEFEALPATYVTKDENDNYTLFIWDKTNSELAEIKLPSAADGIYKIDILGWYTTDEENKLDPISMAVIEEFSAENLVVNYAYISNFLLDTEADGLTDNITDDSAKPNAWAGGKIPVKKKAVINTLNSEKTGIVVEVFPASADITTLDLSLVNSKGGVLPIVFKKEDIVPLGLLTRAASAGALYFIPGTYDGQKEWGKKDDYTKLFNINDDDEYDVLYAFYAKGQKISEYTDFSVGLQEVTSTEGAVANLYDVAAKAPLAGAPYPAKQGVEYSVEFAMTAAPTQAGAPTDAVVDYYLEVANKSDFTTGKFGISFSADKTKFTVTNLPDDLTLAQFTLNVYKLGVDGKIYFETIAIRPVRTGEGVIIPLGDYIINDLDGENGPNFMSRDLVLPLDLMFAALEKIPAGDNTNMKQRWQDADFGAQNLAIRSLTVDGKAMSDAGFVAWRTAMYDAGSTFKGNAKKDGSGTGADILDDWADSYKALSFKMQLPYAIENGTKASFQNKADDSNAGDDIDDSYETKINVPYALTVDFLDKEDDYINSVTFTFTPKLPALDKMFDREEAYWEGNTLYAYYRTPANWAEAGFYTTDQPTGASASGTTSTFYNVLRPTAGTAHTPDAPADGGFTNFGNSSDTKEWIAASRLIWSNKDQKIDGVTLGNDGAENNVAKILPDAAGLGTIVELKNQYAAGKNAYGAEIGMRIKPGNYLGVYTYSDDEIKKQDFNLIIQSAAVAPDANISINKEEISKLQFVAASAETDFEINAKHISGYNYDKSPYSLFKIVDANVEGAQTPGTGYAYEYISEVSFRNPQGTLYSIIDEDNEPVEIGYAVDPVAADPTNGIVAKESYIKIRTSNLKQGDNPVKLEVTVTDRFGKTLVGTVDFTIRRNN